MGVNKLKKKEKKRKEKKKNITYILVLEQFLDAIKALQKIDPS